MVIMSIEKYESTLKKLEMYQDIAISNNKLILERQMMQN